MTQQQNRYDSENYTTYLMDRGFQLGYRYRAVDETASEAAACNVIDSIMNDEGIPAEYRQYFEPEFLDGMAAYDEKRLTLEEHREMLKDITDADIEAAYQELDLIPLEPQQSQCEICHKAFPLANLDEGYCAECWKIIDQGDPLNQPYTRAQEQADLATASYWEHKLAEERFIINGGLGNDVHGNPI